MSRKPKLTHAEIIAARTLIKVALSLREGIGYGFYLGYISAIRHFCASVRETRKTIRTTNRINRLTRVSR